MSKEQKKTLEGVKVDRNLPCVLTDSEKLDYGRKLADLNYGLEDIEYRRKAAIDGFKDESAATAAGIRQLMTSIRDGIERRPVECVWVYHWETLTKQLVRCDTMDVIEHTVIDRDERQIGLGLDRNQ